MNQNTLQKIDFFSCETHHQEHAKSIYDKLPLEIKGKFCTNKFQMINSENNIVAVFCFGDLREVSLAGKKAIFGDHGIGMFYNTEHPSYAGSKIHRDCVILRLSPNKMHAEKEKEVLKCPIKVIGVPKMDKWNWLRNRPNKIRRLKIGLSFHWDCGVVPETKSTFRYYLKVLGSLGQKYEVYGHGHPRIFQRLRQIYKTINIRQVEDFDKVLKECDIYICDNSSTIFEFAYTKKPVILLNAPFYRRNIEHEGNPRFWKYADIGEQVNKPEELFEAIEKTVENYNNEEKIKRQEEITKNMFEYLDGKCSDRAVKIITRFLKQYD